MLDALQADLDLHDQTPPPPPTLEDGHTVRRQPASPPVIYIFLHAESLPFSPVIAAE